MLNRHKWQSGDKLFALRSDWTNAIVRYRKQYHLRADKIAYSGPVYSLLKERHQLGVETFTDSIPKQIEVLGDIYHLHGEGIRTLFIGCGSQP